MPHADSMDNRVEIACAQGRIETHPGKDVRERRQNDLLAQGALLRENTRLTLAGKEQEDHSVRCRVLNNC